MKNEMLSIVAKNCSSFYPRFNMFKSCPDASEPTCDNCRHFENQHCVKDLYDAIATNLDM